MQPRWPKRLQRGRLGRTWGRSWRQDGAMLANLAPKMANMAAFGGPSWLILPIWGSILQESGKSKKPLKTIGFSKALKVGGWGGEVFGGHFGLCWRNLTLSGALLGHLGTILRHLSGKISLRAPRERQESAQERKYEKVKVLGAQKRERTGGGVVNPFLGWRGSIPYH